MPHNAVSITARRERYAPSPSSCRRRPPRARLRQRRAVPRAGEYHDLDALIGSWREDAAFDAAIRAFAQVDEPVWK